eukprot:jgi/Tetstr1/425845/TSEL_016222.t1
MAGSACFNVRVEAPRQSPPVFYFQEAPDAPLARLRHPAEKPLQAVLGERHALSPVLVDRVQTHIYQQEDCWGWVWFNAGACCCCVWGCADQTDAWDWDRDGPEVKRQVVELIAGILEPEEYEILESSSLPGKRMFDPATGGIMVLKLYIKPKQQNG